MTDRTRTDTPLEGEQLMFNRRKYLQGTALAGTAVALAACGLDEGGGDGGDGADGGGEGGAVPFTIYTARDSDLAEKVVEDFEAADRKSTRLNSSHVAISYAVFCLKKKN